MTRILYLAAALALCACAVPEGTSEPEPEELDPTAPEADWMASVQASIDASQHQLREEPDGALRLGNPGQGLRARLEADGAVRVTPTGAVLGAGSGWELELRTTSIGRRGAMEPVEPASPERGDCETEGRVDVEGACLRRAHIERPGLLEWWSSPARGLEQGWVVEAPPAGDGPLVVEVAVEGMEVRVDDGGGSAVLRAGVGRVRYGELLAWDATGRELDAWLEGSDGGLAVVVEDEGASWPVVIDPLLTTVGWSYDPDQGGAKLNAAGSGDFNGDGYSDLVLGTELWDGGQSDEGAAWGFLGSASGLETTPSWTVEIDQAGASFGGDVASAGDVNGDGFTDVIVGASGYTDGQADEGAAFLYLGSASGLATSSSWSGQADYANAEYGVSVASAGDVNGDGFSDIVVGARYHGGQGQAWVHLGSASGVASSAAWSQNSGQSNARFGGKVASAGDVNADGYSDLVVAAYGYDNGQNNEGRVYLFPGSASGLATTATWTAEPNAADAAFGWALSSAGDVDGDGYSDVIVGAPDISVGQFEEGKTYLYSGSSSGLETTASWTHEGNSVEANFGNAVNPAGDVNGDGYADVAIGAGKYSNPETEEGAAYLFLGSATGLSSTHSWFVESNQTGARYGNAQPAGDVDGDGFSDLVVTAWRYDNGQTDEGMAFLYYGSPAGPSTTASWSAESSQNGALLGISVSSAGDVNGDGFDDVIAGAHYYDNGESNEGAAFAYLGSSSGLATTASWSAEGDQDDSAFGRWVASAGDVNADGYSDVIVGANLYDNGEVDEGRAYVFLGSTSGLDPSAVWTTESDQADARLGSNVGSAGDVNADGYSDVLVGAHLYDGGEINEGRAELFLGSASGPEPTPVWSSESDQAEARMGYSVSSAGDVDGDGFDDVLIGATSYTNDQSIEGRAWVFLGSATGPASTAAWIGESDQTESTYGLQAESAGDVNGDGYGDIVVGAQHYDDDQTDEGRVFVYLGSASGPEATASWTVDGDQADDHFGHAVAAAGDVNGDGFSDLLVGAEDYDNGNNEEGKAFLYLGSASGLDSTPAWTGECDQDTCRYGCSVASAGDVNGDGYSDLLIGAKNWDNGNNNEGAAFVYYGNAGDGTDAAWTPAPQALQPSTSTPIPPGLRSTSPSSFDISLLARSPFGHTSAAMEIESKPLGSPFDGTSTVITDYTDTGAAGIQLTHTVDSLAAETGYHWRARLLFDPADAPPQSASRWVYGGLPGHPEGTHVVTGCTADTDSDGQCDSWDPDDDDDGDPDATDCADLDPAIFTGAPETCDGVDEDCDADIDEDFDLDADGQTTCAGDCDDTDPTTYTGAPEPCDGVDNDCDADIDEDSDVDADTYTDCGGDCDDSDASINPAASESCNGVDDDCDTSLPADEADGDADGVMACAGDCDDTDPAVYPGAPETCNGIDDDCDTDIDEGFDADADGVTSCAGDCDDGEPTIYPGAPEYCDLVDSDCDTSLVDEFTNSDTDGEPDCVDTDDDDDGDPDTTDCADTDPAIFTGATEACDAVDSDCDGDLVDGFTNSDTDGQPDCVDTDDDDDGDPDTTDCADTDPAIYTGATESCDTVDSDCDGSLVDAFTDTNSDGEPDCTDDDDDGDGDPDVTDCDDTDASIYNGAPETTLDGIDQDCNGADQIICSIDDDGDGFGGPGVILAPDGDCDDDGESWVDTDCDDADPLAYPLAPEIPGDGIDQDCDGYDIGVACFEDGDGDTFGSTTIITSPDNDCDDAGESDLDTDCDDSDATIFPGATETVGDGVDQDCNGWDDVQCFVDGDGDGVGDGQLISHDGDCTDTGEAITDGDCDDGDPAIYPGAPETPGDGVDQDCNGSDSAECLTDSDGDGYGSAAVILSPDDDCDDGGEAPMTSGGDCDDSAPSIYPDAGEIPNDSVDQDCNGADTVSCFVDGDGDGYGDAGSLSDDGDCVDVGEAVEGGDCDDGSADVYPGAPETANDGIDQDCDGVDMVLCFVDSDDDTFGGDTTIVATDGDCVDAGESTITGDCDDDEPTAFPGATEACDDVDSDCDGDLVDAFADTDADEEPDCIDEDDDGDGFDDGADCGPLDASVYPGAPETCDAVDSDCDGSIVDEDLDSNGDDIPDCVEVDEDGDGFDAVVDCDDTDPAINPDEPEVVDDGIDQDCSGADTVSCFENLDGDSYGSSTVVLAADGECTSVGESDVPGDCDDNNAGVYPGLGEIPDDGVDQDCSGADTVTCYPDGDADGFGGLPEFLTDDGDCTDVGETAVADDCDDTDATSYPGATEVCDTIDQDCDGDTDESFPDMDGDGEIDCLDGDADGDHFPYYDGNVDCDDLDPAIYPNAPESCDLVDSNCDGSLVDDFDDLDGNDVPDCVDPDSDGDGEIDGLDCAPDDPTVYTGAPEIPGDGIDQDCDGLDPVNCWTDGDGDGFGAGDPVVVDDGDCADVPGTVPTDGDCDDDDPLSVPDFPLGELCDGADNDCSGGLEPDEADDDGDLWLACDDFVDRDLGVLGGADCDDDDPAAFPGAIETSDDDVDLNCDGVFGEDVDGDGYALEDGDCHDGDDSIHPDADELCDGWDTDCDGTLSPDESADVDGDGWLACEDCADAVAEVHPDAEEICDGRDSDCDGLMPADELDGDGDGAPACLDCDDADPAAAPGLAEDCEDGIDNDCDGSVDVDADLDADGFGTCSGDCDDGDPTIHPDAQDDCDGLDNDCDGLVDPDFDLDGDGFVACPLSLDRDDCDDDDPTVYPGAPAICDDGVDNDCDPLTLESVDRDGDGFVSCPSEGGDCWEGNPLVYPTAPELCDWIDNDCDGQVDEFLDMDEDGQVPCEGDCEEGVAHAFTGGVEQCDDGIDGDCDGTIDEDCETVVPPDPVHLPPGCTAECAVGESARSPAGLLTLGLLLLGWAGRRRRGRIRAAPTAALLLLALLVPRPAFAGPAEEAAMEAYAFQQRYCAEVAGATSTTTATEALSEVTTVLSRLSKTWDEEGSPFLLFWRGVLLQCVEQDERAAADLEGFLALSGISEDYPSLAKDARRRLRSLAHAQAGTPEPLPAPTVAIGVGGGYQLTAAPSDPYHFGLTSIDVSIKLVGILRLNVFARPSFTGPLRHESGVMVEPRQYTTLLSFGLGPELRWEGPVRPSVSLRLQLAPDDGAHAAGKLLVGALVGSGLDIGLGRSPLALRPMVEVGFLSRLFVLRGGLQVVVGLGPAG